jgi:choline transport protein
MKQEIQSSDEKVWTDVESNSKSVSDDDAMLNATGKVGELKRYGSFLFVQIFADNRA